MLFCGIIGHHTSRVTDVVIVSIQPAVSANPFLLLYFPCYTYSHFGTHYAHSKGECEYQTKAFSDALSSGRYLSLY